MAEYAGEYCKNLGLTIDEFYRASTHPPTMKIANIKKGPIYELSQIRKSRGTSWIKFYESVKSVCDSSFTTPFNSFKVMVDWTRKDVSCFATKKSTNFKLCLTSLSVVCISFRLPLPKTLLFPRKRLK